MAAAAAGGGHLQILQWLWEQNLKFFEDNSAFISAAKAGHLHILQRLQQQPSLEGLKSFVELETHWCLYLTWEISVCRW